jgi:hypothetical protein
MPGWTRNAMIFVRSPKPGLRACSNHFFHLRGAA